MDLNLVRKKLQGFQKTPSSTTKGEKIDYTKIYWKPTPGEYTIRIVPNKFNNDDAFDTLSFYYGMGKSKVLALGPNFQERDPILEFIDDLKKSASDQEDWDLIKKLYPKERYFAHVIVRGEEEKGVRIWEMGKQVLEEILNVMKDPDYGDITDPISGTDLDVTVKAVPNSFNKTSTKAKRNSSQLSSDASLVKLWLDDQKDVKTCFKKRTYDELKQLFESFLNPETTPPSTDAPEKPGKISGKKSSSDKFNALFEEEAK